MKKNIGNVLALYPTPAVVVGTEVNGKVNWQLVAHVGIIGHDRIMLSLFKKHYTNDGVKQTGKVSVNMVNEAMLTGRFNKDTKFDKTDFRSSIPRFQGENLKHNMELVEYVEDLAKKKETSPARIALGWLLAQKPWIVPIPGTKRIERIEENIGGADIQFTSEELADIRCHLDNIEIVGERYPEDQEKMTGL